MHPHLLQRLHPHCASAGARVGVGGLLSVSMSGLPHFPPVMGGNRRSKFNIISKSVLFRVGIFNRLFFLIQLRSRGLYDQYGMATMEGASKAVFPLQEQ